MPSTLPFTAPEPAVAGSDPARRVAVCVATYRRPRGLLRLLDGLDALAFSRVACPTFEVIVVDNDDARSAEHIVAEAVSRLSYRVRYVGEPRRGISHARNAAVRAARAEGFDLIAFLDDDERPEPHWLDELLGVMDEFGADVVAGPVEACFENGRDVPAWVTRGGFFERRQLASGTPLRHAASGNVLMHARVLEGRCDVFHERRALVGGEDTHFFLRIGLAGYRMVWAREALAFEWQPAHRLQVGWLVRRAFRTSSNWAHCEREFVGSPQTVGLRVMKGAWLGATGMLLLPAGALGGRHVAVRGLVRMARGAGYFAGLVGIQYAEYRRTHGA